MNWKHNTVASVWHFPLLDRVNPHLCQWRPERRTIATATSGPASALHSWKQHHLLALPIKSALSWWKWAVEMICCLPTRTFINRLSASTNVTTPFQPFFCSIGHEAGHAPRLLLRWGGIIGGDKHHYHVPQWVLHLNLHVVPWGGWGRGWGKGSSLCADLCVHAIWMSTSVNHAPKSSSPVPQCLQNITH